MRNWSICLILLAMCATPSTGWAASVKHPDVATLQEELKGVKVELKDQAEARTRQADAFNADAQTIAIVTGVAVLLVTLGGIATAILGYRFIQWQVKASLAARVDDAIKTLGREVFEREAERLLKEYDARFAQAYSQYHQLVSDARD